MALKVDKHVLVEKSLQVLSMEKSEMPSKSSEENVAESNQPTNSFISSASNFIIKIDWSKSALEKLPECESKFYYCTSLNLSHNQLEGCLDWIIHLKRLESLDVSHNKLTEIADVCGSSRTLKHLNLSNNLLKELPEWIILLNNLQKLDLSFNPLSKTSTNDLRMAKWKKIEICNLSHMNLSSIPECLLQTANNNLKELYLGNPAKVSSIEENVFWKVPECPSSLVVLDLSYVKLSGLSECNWANLCNLRQFVAKGNDLFWPPDDFTSLSSLEICDLSSSKIIMLPKSFGNLVNLVKLNLAYNKLAVVPMSFQLLENLQLLDLYMNEIDVVEADLALLPKLNKFDFWMNLCSPFECMSKEKYEDLCSKLRLDLGTHDTNARLSNQAQPVHEESSLNPNYGKNFDFEATDDEEQWNPDDEQVEIEKIESSTLSAGTGVEETWDDEVLFSDADSPEAAKMHVGITSVPKKGVQIDDDHYFLPAKLHPKTSCCTAPSQFRVIHGQFDDAE